MLTLAIRLKPDYTDPKYKSTETAHWLPALQASAVAFQQLNELFKDLLSEGPMKSNPAAEQVEGFLGDVNTPPNEYGVVLVRQESLTTLDIPYLPPEVPFTLRLGDTSKDLPEVDEKGSAVVDEEGEPVYKTVTCGAFAGE